MLKISERNPREFEFKGKPILLVSSGFKEVPAGNLLDKLTDAGVNQFRFPVIPTKGSTHKYQRGDTISRNWGGWNEKFWDSLTSTAKSLQKRDAFLFVGVFSTCKRKIISINGEKDGTGRFWDHLWYSENGGPFPDDGVKKFYDFSYRESIDAQKLLLKKICTELPESKYPNVGLFIEWETFVAFKHSKNWLIKMIKYIKPLWGDRPIGIGSDRKEHLEEISKEVGIRIFGILEGVNVKYDTEDREWSPPDKNGLVYEGFHPDRKGYYSRGKPLRKCPLFLPGNEKNIIVQAAENMVAGVKMGMGSVSLPFEQYTKKLTSRVKKDCELEYPTVVDFKHNFVLNELLTFTSTLREAVESGSDLDSIIPEYPDHEKPSPTEPEPEYEYPDLEGDEWDFDEEEKGKPRVEER